MLLKDCSKFGLKLHYTNYKRSFKIPKKSAIKKFNTFHKNDFIKKKLSFTLYKLFKIIFIKSFQIKVNIKVIEEGVKYLPSIIFVM